MKLFFLIYRLGQISLILVKLGFRALLQHSSYIPLSIYLRIAIERLGPIYIKFGQIISTRRDLLSDPVTQELAKLQDQVPPFSSEVACLAVEKALGGSLNQWFLKFDRNPLASASIAQVHAAILPDGREVVVKILRPNIEKLLNRDLLVLYFLAKLAEKFFISARRLRLIRIVQEIDRQLHSEIDLLQEAGNAAQLRRNFLHSSLLYVPEVYWPYCSQKVLVLERIYGIPIANFSLLLQSNIDLKVLAQQGVEIFFTQMLRDCFFHGDMHPGNIFVTQNGIVSQYIVVDFGIVGTLTAVDQRYLAENLLAFFNRNYRRVAELHILSGWVPVETRLEEFEGAMRSVCEPIFSLPLKEISFGKLLLRLMQTAQKFNMELQPQLLLLQKTLFNLEGLGRQLDPDLNLWVTAKPHLEKWLKQQQSLRLFFKKLYQLTPFWLEKLPELPFLMHQQLAQPKIQTELLQYLIRQQMLQQKRMRTGFIILVLIGSALVWFIATYFYSIM